MDQQSSSLGYTIGIDVGGTFTDFVLTRPDGSLVLHKQPSIPDDPSLAVRLGLEALLERQAGLAGSKPRIVHGTTIALNATLQRKVAEIALIVSTGGRDVLEIGRAKLPTPYNFHVTKERPVVERDAIFEIDARIAADGSVLRRPKAAQLDALADAVRSSGVTAAAVMLLNSYVDATLENEVVEGLRERLPGLLVTGSAQIWPEVREFERAVVACINAQVHPLMERYLTRLTDRVGVVGENVLQLSSSAGGTLSVQSARERAIDTMLSGPASGAVAAAKLCRAAGIPAALTFDMGGTSADIAVISDGEVGFTTSSRIGDLPLMMPVVGVSSIGAGGGSIVSVDRYGVLKVGPESAGANPGPVAYGLGGTQPTVTDCYLVLGLIDPDGFLGGRMPLDKAKAEAALAAVAGRLGLPSAAHAAEAALRIATTRMASELFKLLAQKGHEPGRHVIMPFGGAGPTHAAMLAEEAGLAGVAVPNAAATFCAFGAAMADMRRDFVRGLGKRPLASVAETLWTNWDVLEREARAWLTGEGAPLLGERLPLAVDMQYAGQSFSLTVTIPEAVRAARDIGGVAEAFHRAHEAIYGFREPDHAVEAVTQRLSIIGETPKPELARLAPGERHPAPRSRRACFHRGSWVEASVFRRDALGAGATLSGPAVVEQDDTTLWVPPGWSLSVDELGLLNLARSGADVA